jgi:putative redox protein
MATASMEWEGDLRFKGTADSGHSVTMEAALEKGAPTSFASPIEHTLMALCACAGVDVVSILNKMRVPLRGLSISAEAERAESHPRVFTAIRLKFRVEGGVPADKLERAIKLSEETYCSVSAMLAATATISHEIEISP